MRRSFLTITRDTGTIKAQYVALMVMGLVVGSLFWQLPDDQSGANNRVSLIFIAIVNVFFGSSYKIHLMVDSRASSYREKMANMYYPWILYVTEMISDVCIYVPRATLFTIEIYFMCGLNLADGGRRFAGFLGMLWVVYYLGLGFAELWGIITMNDKLGARLFATAFTVMVLFAGFLIREENIPPWWIWLYYGNLVRYPLNFFCVNELEGLSFSCGDDAVPVLVQPTGSYINATTNATVLCTAEQINNPHCFRHTCPITDGQDVLDYFGMTDGIAVYIGITLGLAAATRILNAILYSKIN
mmetsp:Transcript_169/g.326  ORF Transcript_169/g.326 Transcript_169/m.326 type:complete len:300 (+) Transcript_169:1477-2376(+)